MKYDTAEFSLAYNIALFSTCIFNDTKTCISMQNNFNQ